MSPKIKKINMLEGSNKKGFTLVELLVVIAIIGILASVVLVSLNSARQKARDSRRIADIHQISLALENYYDDNGEYPSVNIYTSLVPDYMASVPVDPQTGNMYQYNFNGCTGGPYLQDYVLAATLENSSNSALNSDVDGDDVNGQECNTGCIDPKYCISPAPNP